MKREGQGGRMGDQRAKAAETSVVDGKELKKGCMDTCIVDKNTGNNYIVV